jgi:hypothetical protein
MSSKQDLLNRLRTLAENMERLYKKAAKKQTEIRRSISKLEKRLKNI